ncbi:transcriptional regulator (plasmid) [Rhizobium leguminosarum bv. trifolii CB782]|nr:transcriptional regulator [Rhizobium leguminosarum bv. trifolii CB782]
MFRMKSGSDIYQFGPFRLDMAAGILYRGNEPTILGRRAVVLLCRLLENARTPVSKDALVEAGWGGLAVADNNLTVQIAALRRVLAEADAASWIETLPRRGYRYIGPAVVVNVSGPPVMDHPASALTLPEKPSVAVLPFSNLSGDPEQEYFADGMVDEIITGLARVKGLFVIARNSSFAYRGCAIDVKHVGRELGVRYILEGSVRRAGSNLRVIGQMIDASTGAHVWAQRYERSFASIFALQEEIALSVVGAIAPSVRKAEIERVTRKRPESLDAYDLVLQAQTDVDSGMPEQVTRALALLERAIDLEPGYALAHGNAAMCHHCLFLRAGLQETHRAASIRHARSAILHGQDDAVALTLAGFSMGMDAHDRGAAFAALEAALAVSPSSALTYILGSVILGWGGDAERAIEWSERGMRLSPFDPWAFAAFDAQAMSHLLLGRYEESCRAAYKSVQANP